MENLIEVSSNRQKKFIFSCKNLRKLFPKEMDFDHCHQVKLLLVSIFNILFDLIVILIAYFANLQISKLPFIISLILCLTTFFTIFFNYLLARKNKGANRKLKGVPIAILLLGIIIASLESALELDVSGELSACGHVWCGWIYTTGFDTLGSLEKKFSKRISILVGATYLIIRCFFSWDLKYLILICPALLCLPQRKYVKQEDSQIKKAMDEILEVKTIDKNGTSDIFKQSFEKELLMSSKRVDNSFFEKPSNRFMSNNIYQEKVLQAVSDAIILYNLNEELPLYLNKGAEKLLSSEKKNIIDILKDRFFIIPLIKQDENVNAVMPELSPASSIISHRQMTEENKEERSFLRNPSTNCWVNESLGAVIEKRRKQFLAERLNTGNIKTGEFLSIKVQKARETLFSSGSPQESFPSLILRDSFLVEEKDFLKLGNEENPARPPGTTFEVGLDFFEDIEETKGEKKVFYLIRLRRIDGEGIVQRLQNDIEMFKAQIISSISHELKTPLNCTINMLELLESDFEKEKKKNFGHLEKLRPALQNSRLLSSNINDIIDYSELINNKFALHPTKFSLRKLLLRAIDIVSCAAKERGNTFSFEFDEFVDEVIISDEERISQVVLNLLSNAIKFTLNGKIILRVSPFQSRNVKITVKDSGIGLKNAKINKIGVLGGSNSNMLVGLGLTIANYIASVLGPHEKRGIFARSRSGRGSLFSFYINNLQENKLKASIFSRGSSKMGYEEINLSDTDFFQKGARKNGNKNEFSNLEEVLNAEGELGESIESSISQMESLRREDRDPEGDVDKLIVSLEQKKGTMRFFRSRKRTSIRRSLSAVKENEADYKNKSKQNKNSSHSSIEESNIEKCCKVNELFPMPSTVSLLLGKNSGVSLSEAEHSHEPVVEYLKMASLGYFKTLSVKGDALGRNPTGLLNSNLERIKSETYSECKKKNKNTTIMKSNDFDSYKGRLLSVGKNDFPLYFSEEQNINTKGRFGNLRDLLNFIRKQKACDCKEVLIVDDNGYNTMVLRMMLESLGVRAETANSGDEAILLIKNRLYASDSHGCRIFYLIFMDLDMPEKDGIQTTSEIFDLFEKNKEMMKSVVIACTAFHEREFGQQCFKAGMKDFITKPIKRDLLEEKVLNHLTTFF